MWFWSPGTLAERATVAPLSLRVRAEPVDASEVLRQYPDYYTWVERHPRLEASVLVVALVLASLGLLLAVGGGFGAVRDMVSAA